MPAPAKTPAKFDPTRVRTAATDKIPGSDEVVHETKCGRSIRSHRCVLALLR